MLRLGMLAVLALNLSACVTQTRLPYPPAGTASVVPVGFSPGVRAQGVDWRLEAAPEDIIRRLRAASLDGSLDILALSGGGASGAFGAGALIAAFAFLGSAWDDKLTEALSAVRMARSCSGAGQAANPATPAGPLAPECPIDSANTARDAD